MSTFASPFASDASAPPGPVASFLDLSLGLCKECDEPFPTSEIGSSCLICGSTILDKREIARQDQQRLQREALQREQQDGATSNNRLQRELQERLQGDGRRRRPNPEELIQLVAALAAAGSLPAPHNQGESGGGGDMWETPPPEVMNPQPMQSSSSRPVSKACLERIPKIVVDERSSVLHASSLQVFFTEELEGLSTMTLDCIVGEFGPLPPYTLTGLPLVPADPIIGNKDFTTPLQNSDSLKGSIALFKRGGKINFVVKALAAERAGARGVVVVQDQGVWP